MGCWGKCTDCSTITGTYYANLIGNVPTALKEKRRGKLCCGVLFNHDNTPAYKSSEALADIQNAWFLLLCQPLHSQDMPTIDYYLFFKLKEFVKGCKFADDEAVICMANGWLEDRGSTTESELWRNTGPSAYHLQGTMLKSDKIWRTCLMVNCQSMNFVNAPCVYFLFLLVHTNTCLLFVTVSI